MCQWKKALEMEVIGDKGIVLKVLQKRVYFQHECRQCWTVTLLTPTIKEIIINLFRLCTSKYEEIRDAASNFIWIIMETIFFSEDVVVPLVVDVLQSDVEVNEDAYNVSFFFFSFFMCWN